MKFHALLEVFDTGTDKDFYVVLGFESQEGYAPYFLEQLTDMAIDCVGRRIQTRGGVSSTSFSRSSSSITEKEYEALTRGLEPVFSDETSRFFIFTMDPKSRMTYLVVEFPNVPGKMKFLVEMYRHDANVQKQAMNALCEELYNKLGKGADLRHNTNFVRETYANALKKGEAVVFQGQYTVYLI